MNKLIKNLIIISSIITTTYVLKKLFIDDKQEKEKEKNKINNQDAWYNGGHIEWPKEEGPICRITEEEAKDVWGPCNDI